MLDTDVSFTDFRLECQFVTYWYGVISSKQERPENRSTIRPFYDRLMRQWFWRRTVDDSSNGETDTCSRGEPSSWPSLRSRPGIASPAPRRGLSVDGSRARGRGRRLIGAGFDRGLVDCVRIVLETGQTVPPGLDRFQKRPPFTELFHRKLPLRDGPAFPWPSRDPARGGTRRLRAAIHDHAPCHTGHAGTIILLEDRALCAAGHARMLREKPISIRLGSLQGLSSAAMATIGKIARIDPILTLEGDSPGVAPGVVVIDATDARHGTRAFICVVSDVMSKR
jgi:hypothetical protein